MRIGCHRRVTHTAERRLEPTLILGTSPKISGPWRQLWSRGIVIVTISWVIDEFSARYEDLVTGSYDCGSGVLNAYYPLGCNLGGFCTWWRRLRGSDEGLDDTHLMRMAGRMARRVKAWGDPWDLKFRLTTLVSNGQCITRLVHTLYLGSRAEWTTTNVASELIRLVRGGHSGKPGSVPGGTGRWGM